MGLPRRKPVKRREIPTGVSVALIVLLAVIAVLLSFLAFQKVNGTKSEPTLDSSETVTETPAESAETDTTSTETLPIEEPVAAIEPAALTNPKRLLAVDQTVAVRSIVGECSSQGSIDFSSDGGQTWIPSDSFADTSATQVLRLLPSPGGTTFVVALNQDCEPQIYSTPDNGLTWTGPVSAVGTWYLDPANPTQLGAPGGAKALNCEALALSVVTEQKVGVLCSDGALISSLDQGITWSEPVPIEGALALGSSEEELLVAANGELCQGIGIRDTTGEERSCIRSDTFAVGAGEVALTQSANKILLWVGDTFISSRDGGQTWL